MSTYGTGEMGGTAGREGGGGEGGRGEVVGSWWEGDQHHSPQRDSVRQRTG